MERFVELRGDRYYLEELSKVLISPDFFIVQEGDNFYFKSTDFDLLPSGEEILKKASELLALINGAAKIQLNMQNPITASCVVETRGGGARRVSIWVDTRQNIIGPHDKPEPIFKWLISSRNDKNVEKVLRLYSIDTGWVNLYRIWEVIVNDVGGKSNILNNGWATNTEILRFKHTSNHPEAIGDNARHGVRKTDSPKNPMLLSEANTFIKNIINNWFDSK